MDKVKTFKHANRTVTIYVDPDPVNPIKEYDEMTYMVCSHRRYNLGHEQGEPMTEAELREEVPDIIAVLPLYLFDHSGITIRAGEAFSCSWDSGQVGWAYITRESATKMGCVGEKYDEAFMLNAIRGDVKTYDYYLTGECYGYVIEGADGDELDSCWGFLGDVEYCEAEARSAAEHSSDPAVDREVSELELRVTYAGVAP